MALIKKLVALDDWIQIYAITRRDLPIDSKKITRISLDLNNKREIQEKLQGANAKSITNVFHLAFGGEIACCQIKHTAQVNICIIQVARGHAGENSCCMRSVLTSALLGKWQLFGAQGAPCHMRRIAAALMT